MLAVVGAAVAVAAVACGGGTKVADTTPGGSGSAGPSGSTSPTVSASVTSSPPASTDPLVHECFQAQVVLANAWGRFASDTNYGAKRMNKATTNSERADIARQNEAKLTGDRRRIAAIKHVASERNGFVSLLHGLDEVIHSTAELAKAYQDDSRSEFDAAQSLGSRGFDDANRAVDSLRDPSLCA